MCIAERTLIEKAEKKKKQQKSRGIYRQKKNCYDESLTEQITRYYRAAERQWSKFTEPMSEEPV